MRRILMTFSATIATLVLLFSYKTSLGESATLSSQVSAAHVVTTTTTAAATGTTTTTTGQGPDPTGSTAAAGSATSTSTSTSTTSATPSSVTVDGASEMTRYGAVQVEVVITDGVITDVVALEYPQQDRRDQAINSRAVPALKNQVLSAQSANVAGVSGATYTTDGYLTSLQSALDAAGFQG